MKRLAFAALFGLGLIGACGGDEALRATPAPGADAGPDVTLAPDAGAPDATPPDAGPVKRRVFTRIPFGNVGASDNLLWDGDFEWQSAFAQQYGWVDAASIISVSGFGQIRVGPACKSGMKCGFLTQGQKIAAVGVSPSQGAVSASVWIKPPKGDCSDLAVMLFACDYGDDPDMPLVDSDGPNAEGWCEFQAMSPERKRASCLSVEARFADGEALVDDAVVRAAPPGAKLVTGRAATAAERAAAATLRRFLREWLKPAQRPPSAALEAYRKWRSEW